MQPPKHTSLMNSSRPAVTAFYDDVEKAYFAERLLVKSRRCFEELCKCLYPEEILAVVASTPKLRRTFLSIPGGGRPPESAKLIEMCIKSYNRIIWNFDHARAVAFGETNDTAVAEAFDASRLRRHSRRRRP